MDNYNVTVITSKIHFDLIFNGFKESAKIKSNPDIYLVGLDVEYISKENNQF